MAIIAVGISVTSAEDAPNQSQKITLSGQVQDQGIPKAGLTVHWLVPERYAEDGPTQSSDGQLIPMWKELAAGQTDNAGHFHLEVDRESEEGVLQVTCREGLVISRHVSFRRELRKSNGNSVDQLTINVPQVESMRMRVLDEGGQALANAEVHRQEWERNAQWFGAVFPSVYSQVGLTDNEGYVDVLVNRQSQQFIWATQVGYLPHRIVLGPKRLGVSLHDPFSMRDGGDVRFSEEIKSLEMTLVRTKTVTGRLLQDETSNLPAPDVTVVVEPILKRLLVKGDVAPPRVLTRTGPDGRFRVTAFPRIPLEVSAWKEDRCLDFQIHERAQDSELDLGDLIMKPGVLLRGVVIDRESGKTVDIEGARVVNQPHLLPGIESIIDKQGRFEQRVPYKYFMRANIQLVEHPEYVSSESSSPIRPARPGKDEQITIYVQRRPVELSDDEVRLELPRFVEEYRLSTGQTVKRIARPYPMAREAFFQADRLKRIQYPQGLAGLPSLSNLGGQAPFSAAYSVNDQGQIRFRRGGSGPLDIREVLTSLVKGLRAERIQERDINRVPVRDQKQPNRFPDGVLTRLQSPILTSQLHDIIIQENLSLEDLIPALNASFEQEPVVPIRLTLSESPFSTLVIKSQPIPERFENPPVMRLVPSKYEDRTLMSHDGTWLDFIDSVAGKLNLCWKIEGSAVDMRGNLKSEYPFARDQGGLQEIAEVIPMMRDMAPFAFKESFGVDVVIEKTVLPVVLVEVLKN